MKLNEAEWGVVTMVGVLAMVATVLIVMAPKAEPQAPKRSEQSERYLLPSNNAYQPTVITWRDPDTGCSYLVVMTGRSDGGIAITPRMTANGRQLCSAK